MRRREGEEVVRRLLLKCGFDSRRDSFFFVFFFFVCLFVNLLTPSAARKNMQTHMGRTHRR